MYFSLIVATLNRTEELESLFNSLIKQDYLQFEVIVIDQNSHDLVKDIYLSYINKINIKYFKVEFKGLSKARNYGLKFACGSIIAFPDDDCVYSTDVLSRVARFFSNNNIDVLTGDTFDLITGEKYLKTLNNDTIINYSNVFKSAISYTIFIRPKIISDIYFDENLGVGAKFGSAEETDLIIKLLKLKYIGHYTPSILVYHPFSKNSDLVRNYNYALGFGAVHRKHFDLNNIKIHYIYFVIVSVLKIILLKNPKLNFNILKAKIIGFIDYAKI